jgi:sulfoxide reductase heme-binding subunit YedZ
MSLLDASSLAGLFALVVITFNFLLGLLLSTAYKRSPIWKKLPAVVRKIDVNDVHNWTAYVALLLILIHPILLVFDKESKFKLQHIVFPFNAPHQPFIVAFGVIAFYALIIVIITTQKGIKKNLGFRAWKNIHLISYGTALLICLHGIFIDQNLKGNTPDFLDGEKLLCEVCLLVMVIFSIIRVRFYFKNIR